MNNIENNINNVKSANLPLSHVSHLRALFLSYCFPPYPPLPSLISTSDTNPNKNNIVNVGANDLDPANGNKNDKQNNEPVITPSSLQRIYAALGMNFTLKECNNFIESHVDSAAHNNNSSNNNNITGPYMTFSDFLTFHANCHSSSSSTHHDMKLLFAFLSPDGALTLGRLRQVLEGMEYTRLQEQATGHRHMNYALHMDERTQNMSYKEKIDKLLRESFHARLHKKFANFNDEIEISFQEFVDFWFS